MPNEERTEPTFALRFSVYTLTHTPEGECWTLSQCSDWLKQAGFQIHQNARRYSQDLAGNDADLGAKDLTACSPPRHEEKFLDEFFPAAFPFAQTFALFLAGGDDAAPLFFVVEEFFFLIWRVGGDL